jgi:hypothetical protein
VSTNAPITDIIGTARPQGAAYDIGAYEYIEGSGPPIPPAISNFGIDTGNSTESLPEGDLQAQRFQNNSGTGNLSKIELKFNQTTASGNVRLGVYADSSGIPGALLLDAGVVAIGTGWVNKSGLTLAVTNASYYWLAFIMDTRNTVELLTGQAANSHIYHYQAYGALTNPIAAPINYSSDQFVMRATVGVTVSDPSVSTSAASNVTLNSAQLNGGISDFGSETGNIGCSFQYGTTTGVYTQGTPINYAGSPLSYSAVITGLTPGTNYYFRFRATATNTVYGSELNFTTDGSGAGAIGLDAGDSTASKLPNYLSSQRILNSEGTGTLTQLQLKFEQVTATGNVRMGVYADNNGAPDYLLLDAGTVACATAWTGISSLTLPVTQGSYYWLSHVMSATNTESILVTGETDAKYYVSQTYGSLPSTFPGGGTYADEADVIRAFVTVEVTSPTIATPSDSAVGTTSAQLNGEVTSMGGASSVQVSFQYGTVSGTWTNETAPQTLITATTFNSVITGLTPSTTYYFRTKCNWTGGVIYSAIHSLATTAATTIDINAYIQGTYYDFKQDSLRIHNVLGERGSVELEIHDSAGAYNFVNGQELRVHLLGTNIFGGFIDDPSYKMLTPTGGLKWHIVGKDNKYLADKRIMTTRYINQTCGSIVWSIWYNRLMAEGVQYGTVEAGVTIPDININYAACSDAFDKLAELSDYVWNIDENRVLSFTSKTTVPAAATLTSADILIGTENVSLKMPFYRNVQVIRAKGISDLKTESRTGDGVQQTFVLALPLNKVPTITVDSDYKTVGIQGVDTGQEFYWNKGSNIVSAAVAPINNAAIVFEYYGQYDQVSTVYDDAEITARKAIELATSGWVVDVEEQTDLMGDTAPTDYANYLLTQYARTGKELKFSTMTSGLKVGQKLTVNYPALGFTNEDTLITEVTITLKQNKVFYDITCITGAFLGSYARYFFQIASQKSIPNLINISS